MGLTWFSEACAKTLRSGSRTADTWMAEAPERLVQLASELGIEVGAPLLGGHTGAVCGGWLDGAPVICKLTLDRSFAAREASSLQWLKSSGRVPEVVVVDVEQGFLVVTRVLPGTAAGAGDLGAVAELVGRLHTVAAVEGIPDVRELVSNRSAELVRHCAVLGLDPDHLGRARAALVSDNAVSVVCHGDFGPANILDGPDGALWAIDPECVVGSPAFDIAGWAIRRDGRTAIATTTALAALCDIDQREALAWLGWMAFDEAVSHTIYGLPVAAEEWALAEALGVLPSRS
jgi:hypothetical protein